MGFVSPILSSGDNISLEWAPKAVASGAYAIDNSAAFRMNAKYPLVVPEVNGNLLDQLKVPTIIANPNCSTIQLIVALQPLKKFGLKEIRVATYQSVSGAGKAGREEFLAQTREQLATGKIQTPATTFPHEIAFNCIPQIGSFNDAGYCSEEIKIINETKKILGLESLKVSAFTVRIPSLNSHSGAVWVTLDREVSKDTILSSLREAQGVTLSDQSCTSDYPTARMTSGQNPVFVGRVHQDLNDKKTWLMWVVADNILKGAALNGIQIAETLFANKQ